MSAASALLMPLPPWLTVSRKNSSRIPTNR